MKTVITKNYLKSIIKKILNEQQFKKTAPDNSLFIKPANLKEIGWIVISKKKNDGRPLYELYDGDKKEWGAMGRMGTGKYTEKHKLFYTVPIKVNKQKKLLYILNDDEKWGSPIKYDSIGLNNFLASHQLKEGTEIIVVGDTVVLLRPLATFRKIIHQGTKAKVQSISKDSGLYWLDGIGYVEKKDIKKA